MDPGQSLPQSIHKFQVPSKMSGFPPNLEDGELWLPSDVFHEIQSTNTHRENRSNYALNIAHSHPVQAVVGPRTSAASSFPSIAINFKVVSLCFLEIS